MQLRRGHRLLQVRVLPVTTGAAAITLLLLSGCAPKWAPPPSIQLALSPVAGPTGRSDVSIGVPIGKQDIVGSSCDDSRFVFSKREPAYLFLTATLDQSDLGKKVACTVDLSTTGSTDVSVLVVSEPDPAQGPNNQQ